MPAPTYYMACIDLTGRAVLVVGAGRVALEKIEGLLAVGAEITVVAPQVLPEVEGLDETVGDLAILQGLDRQGDSKEN